MPVPMFPLRGVRLYPGLQLPLHVFEPRYRQMVEYLMDRDGRLIVPTATPETGEGLPLLLLDPGPEAGQQIFQGAILAGRCADLAACGPSWAPRHPRGTSWRASPPASERDVAVQAV